MYNKENQPWYEAIPYGPLTEDVFSRLASKIDVAGREDMTRVARERGIKPGESLALGFRKIKEHRAKLPAQTTEQGAEANE